MLEVSPFQRRLWLAFAAIWVALAIHPRDRATWALENVLVLLLSLVALLVHRRFSPSRRASLLLFTFLCLHELGAHYTYSEVPYAHWFEALTGRDLNQLTGWRRNHYDRLVHFGGGVLLVPMARELLRTFSGLGEFGVRLGALSAAMSASMVYELIEWGAASVFGQGIGAAYLGTQGDPWDAQKDMALAGLGALLAIAAPASKAQRSSECTTEWLGEG